MWAAAVPEACDACGENVGGVGKVAATGTALAGVAGAATATGTAVGVAGKAACKTATGKVAEPANDPGLEAADGGALSDLAAVADAGNAAATLAAAPLQAILG